MNRSHHTNILKWWADDDFDHGRPTINNPDVQRLVASMNPMSQISDLGGTMSLNLKLNPAGLVLRVHQPFVSKHRILAVQEVRRQLSKLGLVVPVPVSWVNSTIFRCGNRWAELEEYIPHERYKPSLDSYTWMFREMGTLHRVLTTLQLTVPRPLVATYATPTTLKRWLSVTETVVQADPEAYDIARLLRKLIRRLSIQWIPAIRLPTQLVHGDVRLSNFCRTPEGKAVYLDFGFLANRPRIHDLSYSIAFMVLALNGNQALESFAWQSVAQLVKEYEDASNCRLTVDEWRALIPYTVSVCLYHTALDGFKDDPTKSIRQLRSRVPFLRLGERLMENSEVIIH